MRYRGWLLALFLLVPVGVFAQQADEEAVVEKAVAEETVANKKPADVRVIIDVSGSMKQNDPSNLRQPALELLVKLLPEGSKAGVWTFGKYINMLVPHRPVNDAWREDAMAKAAQINSVGLFTNIGEAIEKAGYGGDKPSEQYETSLILLTDGMVDIDKDPEKNQQEWRRIVDEVLPELQGSGYTMHTIALSDNADTALLDKLALSTDGMSEVADSADELLKIFLRVFDQAAPTEQVPLTENTFLVDSSIEEFTALIFRSSDEPTQLVSPDKTVYQFDKEDEDVNWYKTDQYDLITVKQPLEGEWQVLADIAPDSRVSIVSNLKLLVKPLPTNLFVDETARLSLLLQDERQTITDPDFLGLLDINSLVSHQDSAQEWPEELSAGQPPHSGIYSTDLTMFSNEGRYGVSVVVDGKSFQRKFNHFISVRVPFEVWLEKLVLAGQEKQLVKVRGHSQLIVPDSTRVVARIKDPKGRSSIKPLQLNASDEWELLLEPEQEGTYQVRLRISGEDRDGAPFDVDPETLSFTFPSEDNPFALPPIQTLEPTVEESPPAIEAKPEPPVEPQQVIEEPVVIASQPEPEALVDEEPEAEDEEGSNWPLYVGLGVGNILIVILAFVAYRVIMGGNKDESLEELEATTQDAEGAAEESVKPIEMESASTEPQMDESPGIEPEDDDSIDLASDDISDSDIPDLHEEAQLTAEADELLAGLQDPEEPELVPEADLDVGDGETDDTQGFSLDDFSPDSLDDLISDEQDKKEP